MAGRAYVYAQSSLGTWATATTFTADSTDFYGWSVALDNTFAVVSGLGKVVTYKTNSVGAFTDTANTVITNDAYFFGWAVDISGDYLIASAMNGYHLVTGVTSLSGNGNPQMAFIYQYNSVAGTWGTTPVASITAYRGETNFGYAVAIKGDHAMVTDASKVYIFKRTSGTWSNTAVAIIDGYTTVPAFGTSLAMQEDYAIVGSNHSAFIFGLSGGTWSTTAVRSYFYESVPFFGQYVAMDGNFTIVASGSGGSASLYVFALSAGTWGTSPVHTISLGNGMPSSLAMSESHFILGDHLNKQAGIYED